MFISQTIVGSEVALFGRLFIIANSYLIYTDGYIDYYFSNTTLYSGYVLSGNSLQANIVIPNYSKLIHFIVDQVDNGQLYRYDFAILQDWLPKSSNYTTRFIGICINRFMLQITYVSNDTFTVNCSKYDFDTGSLLNFDYTTNVYLYY